MSAIWSDKYGIYLYDSDYLKKKEERRRRRSDHPKDEHTKVIKEFIDEFCRYDTSAEAIEGSKIYDLYCKFCQSKGYNYMTICGFTRAFKLIVVRDEYIKDIQFSNQMKLVKRTSKPNMRYPVTYFHNIKIIKGEIK